MTLARNGESNEGMNQNDGKGKKQPFLKLKKFSHGEMTARHNIIDIINTPPSPIRKVGHLTCTFLKRITTIILAYSGASIHDNT
jgi:hypothetical protein